MWHGLFAGCVEIMNLAENVGWVGPSSVWFGGGVWVGFKGQFAHNSVFYP